MRSNIILFVCLLICLNASATAGEAPYALIAWRGSTPTLDGIISPGEWDDAEFFYGVQDWQSDTPPASQDSLDLSATIWTKHDGEYLYFAFDVMDDVLYGFDIDRWVHSNNPDANEMSPQGWPWWGDGVEIMMNSTYKWKATGGCVGDGRSWQVVTSTHKSTLHGLEQGGLMAGEPRVTAWDVYEGWAENGDMEVAVRLKDKNKGRGYVIEWRIHPNPCMQIDESTFVDLTKKNRIGINFEIQDLDEKEKGNGNWSNMHHIDYWTKVGSNPKTDLRSFATLIIEPDQLSNAAKQKINHLEQFELLQNFPNPFNPSTTISYSLPYATDVQLDIYNTRGHHIQSLVSSHQKKGRYSIVWDSRNSDGEFVASGLYFYRLRTTRFIQTRKLVRID